MIRLPDDTESTLALADWVEASLLVLSEEPYRISDADITGALTDGGLDAEQGRENITNEISRREQLLGDVYPLFRDGEGFSLREPREQWLPYSFLLMASLNQSFAELVYADGVASVPARLFEELTSQALRTYVGGQAIRIGANRRAPVPAAFPAAVAYAANELREDCTYGGLEPQIGGDDGCDVIAWRPFPDAQPSQLIVLAQCGIGLGWKAKRSELDEDVWAEHINWHAKPVHAFAVPFVHETGNTWRETSKRGGVLLDRLRLASLIDAAAIPDHVRQEVEDWLVTRQQAVSALSVDQV